MEAEKAREIRKCLNELEKVKKAKRCNPLQTRFFKYAHYSHH